MTTLTERSVISAIKRMTESGYLKSERGNRRGGQSNRYYMSKELLGLSEPTSHEEDSHERVSYETGALLSESDDVIKCISRHANKEEPLLTVREPKSIKPTQPRASRIPETFSVTQDHRDFAANNGFPNPDDEIGSFLDYWRAKPGKDGTKLDWDATFRNWLRNAAKYSNKPKPISNPSQVRVVKNKAGKVLYTEPLQ